MTKKSCELSNFYKSNKSQRQANWIYFHLAVLSYGGRDLYIDNTNKNIVI